MIRIQQLKLPSDHSGEALKQSILKALHCREESLISYKIVKRSLDARKKPQIAFVYTVDVALKEEENILKRCRLKQVSIAPTSVYHPPKHGTTPLDYRPVVVGSGPAGLFCSLLLAREGYRPLLLERGEAVEQRQKDVEAFWRDGILKERSNVQFGEGGAGTFSDGKLNTAVKDASGRNHFVLKTFVQCGAPEEILYLNKPHIGTDILRTVVHNMREEILQQGGEVRFLSQLTDIRITDGAVSEICINDQEWMPCSQLVLAIGHSARDTFAMLAGKPILMAQKPFAVGVRIEHPQAMIDLSQYGRERGLKLPAADYKLTRKMPDGRGVYSFCMCPGGYVVNASSEQGYTAVNGMSFHDRNGTNANSAMVVTVSRKDFGSDHVLAGMEFQRKLERAAFLSGEGKVPVQLLGDFCRREPTRALGEISPAIKGSYALSRLDNCFDRPVYEALKDGILQCGALIRGFDREDAVLSGVESRTSSPVRIHRNERMQSNVEGLYPCGEGAGYAGGITSAAMDGLKVAEMLIRQFSADVVTKI